MSEEKQQKRIGAGMVIAAWILVVLLATGLFERLLDKQHNPNQGRHNMSQAEVTLKRNRYGHYVASGLINGQEVVFFIDTGASDVSIPISVAEKLQLAKGARAIYNTANGPITAYRTTLDSIQLGGITLHNIHASINPMEKDEVILLGMSFLRHLEFTQRGNTLTLTPYRH
ncbi:MAG: retroviral-like aspartic protease family protein [Gammaproteobacteria bacterium]|nr:retroviral-like aspartic protease family protein [Gammaproteobacteria bacterium]